MQFGRRIAIRSPRASPSRLRPQAVRRVPARRSSYVCFVEEVMTATRRGERRAASSGRSIRVSSFSPALASLASRPRPLSRTPRPPQNTRWRRAVLYWRLSLRGSALRCNARSSPSFCSPGSWRARSDSPISSSTAELLEIRPSPFPPERARYPSELILAVEIPSRDDDFLGTVERSILPGMAGGAAVASRSSHRGIEYLVVRPPGTGSVICVASFQRLALITLSRDAMRRALSTLMRLDPGLSDDPSFRSV